jgi:radical SAM protein with 4Fe4S-binding SPASM domain
LKRPSPSAVLEFLNLISKLTFRRAWNAGKVLVSYAYSRVTSKASLWGLPMSISVEPTTSCNLRCPECPSGLRSFTRDTGMLEEDFFKKTIDDTNSHLIYLNLYFQGEPYLNTKLLEMVKYASSKNIYTATSTNAHNLTDDVAKRTVESGLDRMIISIDGTTQDVYERYRVGGNLSKVLEGTKHIVKWKKRLKSRTPLIVFQFLVVKPNEHQVEDVKKLGKEYQVDEVRLKTAQVYEFENGHELIPTMEKYARYKKSPSGKWSIKSKLSNHCWRMWHSCVITWDGWVVPCCFDKDAKHKFGSLKQQRFKELWQNESYRDFRTSVMNARREIGICSNCAEGTNPWD